MSQHISQVRVFKNRYLEDLTHVNPLTPAILWIPFSSFLVWRSLALNEVGFLATSMAFVAGLLVWTLAEYLIHRYAFHFNAQSDFSKRMVFLFHGLHHDDPKDHTRLVMPAAPAAIYTFLFYVLFGVILGIYRDGFLAGFMVGYLVYDYTHYAIHFFKPRTFWGKYLRKFHLKHHSAEPNAKFGVSSPLWDLVFRSMGR